MTDLSDKDQVRLLISDVGGKDDKTFTFTDTEIETFLGINDGNVRIAAALALRVLAGNEAMVAKKITFLELKTDGPAMAKALRGLADDLEDMADGDVDIEFIEMGVDLFSRREIRLGQFGEYW